ncbi:hypothetical protein K4L44_16245 [Halosquirtibacter laminarini]|uniref:Uncharacterized protein n=1 Tax=Halosquirtibacter laminarini TaxID=3374600 RepID=A0AC61NEP7_9BACT|nr:hypothetical protein K4L44_16245 [Prolixibacteraceae bacterium]
MKYFIYTLLACLLCTACSSSSDSTTDSLLKDITLDIHLKHPTLVTRRQKLYVTVYDQKNSNVVQSKEIEKLENQQVNLKVTPDTPLLLKVEAKQGNTVKSSIYEQSIVASEKGTNFDITASLTTFNRINSGLLRNCVMCHTANLAEQNGHLALDKDVAYDNLVNQQAHKTTMMRVTPKDLDNSYLLKVLKKEVSWNHQYEVLDPVEVEILETWIKEGALKN